MELARLDATQLPAIQRVLADACDYDAAAAVAAEVLFDPLPVPAVAWGAWRDGKLVGVGAYAGSRVTLLAVTPAARGQGTGSRLLTHLEDALAQAGVATSSALDLPGRYLAPGIDVRNQATLAWLERRGWVRFGELRRNLYVAVRNNPRVTSERLADVCAGLGAMGYALRRAAPDEPLLPMVETNFGGAWPTEVARALAYRPAPAVFVGVHQGVVVGFACHDAVNAGLGWFGPTGTLPAHRGKGLGEALLLACLLDIAVAHPRAEIAWLGPVGFYEKVCGVAGQREFVAMRKALAVPAR